MDARDTSLGGPRRDFPATTMGLLGRLGDLSDPGLRGAVESLCVRYWKPVYRYLRLSWARPNEDAKDLAQAFFLWLLDGDALRKYAPERGSFRRYLKTLLRRFVGHEQEALDRLKRGGGVRILTLDGDVAPLRNVLDDPASTDPERLFDRQWLDDLVRHAIESVRKRFLSGGRAVAFRVFEEYDLAPAGDGKPSYAEVAARLGLKESDVRNHLFAVREAVRAELRAELSEMTPDERALEEEWNELFGAS